MDDRIKFDEPPLTFKNTIRSRGVSSLLIKLGLAKDSESAAKVLLVISIIAILIAVSIPYIFSAEPLPDDGKGLEIAGPQS